MQYRDIIKSLFRWQRQCFSYLPLDVCFSCTSIICDVSSSWSLAGLRDLLFSLIIVIPLHDLIGGINDCLFRDEIALTTCERGITNMCSTWNCHSSNNAETTLYNWNNHRQWDDKLIYLIAVDQYSDLGCLTYLITPVILLTSKNLPFNF